MPTFTFYFHGRNISDGSEYEAEAQRTLPSLPEAIAGLHSGRIQPDVEDYNEDVDLHYVDIFDESGTNELETVEL